MKSSLNRPVKPGSITSRLLKDDGAIPNNEKLPLLIYHDALELPEVDPASSIESLLADNGWTNGWRNGIYSYHHYHSTAHEVLVVYAGCAKVKLGGENGVTADIAAGDVLVLPAGVGHKNLGASDDFAVFGAYPKGQDYDLLYGKPGERPQADNNIARVPLPELDPVFGKDGPLLKHWHAGSGRGSG